MTFSVNAIFCSVIFIVQDAVIFTVCTIAALHSFPLSSRKRHQEVMSHMYFLRVHEIVHVLAKHDLKMM